MTSHQWRITKYDPRLRDASGRFLGDDWTSVWDIGKMSLGQLTAADYLRIESAYVTTARSFAVESGVFAMRIVELEIDTIDESDLTMIGLPSIEPALHIQEGAVLPINRLGGVVRAVLRELVWCKIESDSFFIHFGRDYYMYVGSDSACEHSQDTAQIAGLYVEKWNSPYR